MSVIINNNVATKCTFTNHTKVDLRAGNLLLGGPGQPMITLRRDSHVCTEGVYNLQVPLKAQANLENRHTCLILALSLLDA